MRSQAIVDGRLQKMVIRGKYRDISIFINLADPVTTLTVALKLYYVTYHSPVVVANPNLQQGRKKEGSSIARRANSLPKKV